MTNEENQSHKQILVKIMMQFENTSIISLLVTCYLRELWNNNFDISRTIIIVLIIIYQQS